MLLHIFRTNIEKKKTSMKMCYHVAVEVRMWLWSHTHHTREHGWVGKMLGW